MAVVEKNIYSLLGESIFISNFRLILLLPFPRASFSPAADQKKLFDAGDKIHAEISESHSIASGFSNCWSVICSMKFAVLLHIRLFTLARLQDPPAHVAFHLKLCV